MFNVYRNGKVLLRSCVMSSLSRHPQPTKQGMSPFRYHFVQYDRLSVFANFTIRKNIFAVFLVLFFSLQLSAQESDSLIVQTVEESISSDTVAPLKTEKIHSPKKAAWMSAVLPGLGQGYNKKYWKIPIVYVGFAGTSVGIWYFHKEFKYYRDEYRNRLNEKTDLLRLELKGMSNENVNANKQLNQRNMEIFILVTGVWYLLNIVDAVVDAHLFSFDVSDDLTMSIFPLFQPNYMGTSSFGKSPTAGISFVFNLK